MGLFAIDEHQDERLDQLEEHLRSITETMQREQISAAQTRISLLKIQTQLEDKLSEADFDPTIIQLNEQLSKARNDYDGVAEAATSSWNKMQKSAADTLSSLSKSLDEASKKTGNNS